MECHFILNINVFKTTELNFLFQQKASRNDSVPFYSRIVCTQSSVS